MAKEKKAKSWLALLLSLQVVLFASNSRADDVAGEEAHQAVVSSKAELHITADKVAEPDSAITQKLDVVTKSQIDQMTFSKGNLAEAFRYQPSTSVNILSRNDANWGSYGGLGPKYNLYMLDGLPIDSFVDLMAIDPWVLNRAEVQRGPAAVLYPNYLNMDFAGNESPLAGITNLLTHDNISNSLTKVQTGYGSWSTRSARLYHQGASGDMKYFLGGGLEESDYKNYGTTDSWLHIQQDPDYNKNKVYGKIEYAIEPDHQALSLFFNHAEHSGNAGRPNRGFDHHYDLINAAYMNKLNDLWQASVKAGFRAYNREWQEDNYPDLALRETDNVKQSIVPVDVSATYAGFGLLTFGADLQSSSYQTSAVTDGIKAESNDVNALATGIYAQEKVNFDNLVIRGGLRYSYNNQDYDLVSGTSPSDSTKSWDKLLWSAGTRYSVTDQVALYGNVGQSYLVPSAKSVAGTLRSEDLGVMGENGQLPNPTLSPESGIGYDSGLEVLAGDGLRFGVRAFYNVVDEAIVENRVSNEPSQSMSVNAGKLQSGGFEAETKYEVSANAELFANYTYTYTSVSNEVDADQDGGKVPFVPSYLINTGAALRFPWEFEVSPYLSVVGHYYDSTSTSSRKSFGNYPLVNMSLKKLVINQCYYRGKIGLDIENLLDRKHEMPWQFQDPGFNAMLTFELELM